MVESLNGRIRLGKRLLVMGHSEAQCSKFKAEEQGLGTESFNMLKAEGLKIKVQSSK
jgi:hypothetical protein